MLHSIPELLINPHLQTTNIYVRRAILLENLKKISIFLNYRPGVNISTNLYWELKQLEKTQRQALKIVNESISVKEQDEFRFGS